ncbi:uncharacterized protein LOC34621057 [Cyclospora cayetanensis]|uniref:Phosphodiesterase n=1 Tax=Cyclospora cayetanensis TaxID=88456 RepID=A0A6P6RWE9_9EIME|nr:uncharacterized protein LOC34621057 [Cyclospora cayetanensis]
MHPWALDPDNCFAFACFRAKLQKGGARYGAASMRCPCVQIGISPRSIENTIGGEGLFLSLSYAEIAQGNCRAWEVNDEVQSKHAKCKLRAAKIPGALDVLCRYSLAPAEGEFHVFCSTAKNISFRSHLNGATACGTVRVEKKGRVPANFNLARLSSSIAASCSSLLTAAPRITRAVLLVPGLISLPSGRNCSLSTSSREGRAPSASRVQPNGGSGSRVGACNCGVHLRRSPIRSGRAHGGPIHFTAALVVLRGPRRESHSESSARAARAVLGPAAAAAAALMAVFGEGGGSPSHSGGLLERSNSAGEGIRSMPNSSPLSPSPILRKSGSLTPAQSASASAAAAAAAAVRSSNGNGRDDDRRREFQRVKTVSFANLENVTDGDLLQGAAAGELPPSLQNDGAVSSPLEAPILCGVELDGGELLVMDDDTDHPSVSEASGAYGQYTHSYSSTSNTSLYVPLGTRLGYACWCACCTRICSLCKKLSPSSDLAFHTKEDLMQEQLHSKRQARLLSRSSTMSSASGVCRSNSLRGSSNSAEKLMRAFPLVFINKELEELFALNVNHWMRIRLIPMCLLLLVLTFAMWPLLAWSFDQQTTFDHTSTIGIMFNSAMAVTVVTSIALGFSGFCTATRNYAEHLTSIALLLLVTMWGVWNSMASYLLESQAEHANDFRSTEESTALEACTAMSYLYGLLPVVLIDVVLPSRTKYSWLIHVSFFGTSAASIDTRRRVDRLESDLKRQRSRGGVSTSVEQLVHLVKQMQESNQLALAAAADGLRPDLRSQLQESKTMLQQCLSILCTTTNLYAVNFGPLDNVEHMDIIRSLLNDKNALPKDWVRARDSLPSSLTQSETGPRRESNGEQTRNNSAPAGGKTVVSAGERLPSVPPPQASEKRPLGGAAVCVAEEIPMATGRRAVGAEAGKLLQQGVQLLPLPRSRRGSHAAEETPFSKPPEEGAEKNSTRSSVFSDMLQRPRRVSRATHERITAGEDKLLKVAYLFSPTPTGGSNATGAPSEWKFDMLAYGRETGAPLPELGFLLLSPFCLESGLCSEQTLAKFLKAVDKHYLCVPYHNALHGLMVAQKTYALLNLVSLVKSRQARDMALIIVAGLCHDIGHPGRNNALFSNAMEPLALLYNDRAVLENYHACLTFKTLEKQDCDIFVTLKTREYLMVRTQIIELILATDMKGHFETVSRFRVRRSAPDFDLFSEDDFWFLVRMFIKASDISHCGVEWGQHFEWCQRVLNEFYDQGDEERLRCLPISPLCDREKHGDAAKSQMGFINFVAKPLFDELAAVDISGTVEKEVMTNLRSNASRWEALSNAGVVIPLFLDQWPASLLTSSSFPPLTTAAIASAAATTAANAAAPTGSKVQLINQKIKLQKSAEGVNVTKIDLRSLLSQGEAGRHRHSTAAAPAAAAARAAAAASLRSLARVPGKAADTENGGTRNSRGARNSPSTARPADNTFVAAAALAASTAAESTVARAACVEAATAPPDANATSRCPCRCCRMRRCAAGRLGASWKAPNAGASAAKKPRKKHRTTNRKAMPLKGLNRFATHSAIPLPLLSPSFPSPLSSPRKNNQDRPPGNIPPSDAALSNVAPSQESRAGRSPPTASSPLGSLESLRELFPPPVPTGRHNKSSRAVLTRPSTSADTRTSCTKITNAKLPQHGHEGKAARAACPSLCARAPG